MRSWAAESPACANETFNINNGDVFEWRQVWPAIADALGMAVGPEEPCSLAETMPPREPEWAAIVARYGLRSPARLSDFVADDGLICAVCEPMGHVHRDGIPEEYLAEIRKGVNEQSFALWEYQQMFDAAGLEVAAAQLDVGSVKVALRPRR